MIRRLTALFERRPTTAEGWLVRMGRPKVSTRDQTEFLDWLEADETHLALYEDAKSGSAALDTLRRELAPEITRLRWPRRRQVAAPGFVIAGGLVTAAIIGAVMLAPMLRDQPEGRLYQSAPHAITDVVLADGSHVTLDAGSAIRVALAGDARRVILEHGSAYFDVAHDANHPFQVAVADRNVIVIGTRFATALRDEGAEVSLLQGRVVLTRRDVADRDALAEGLAMAPGDRAAYRAGDPEIRKTRIDVDAATSWRRRRLAFRDAPLSMVIEAAARYSETPLVVADADLDRIRVTVVLPLDGQGALSDRLAALLPVRTQQTSDGRILVRAD